MKKHPAREQEKKKERTQVTMVLKAQGNKIRKKKGPKVQLVLKALLGIDAMVFFRVQKKVQGEARPSPNRGR
jgi:hypothetical protein